ncbi:hypothetical protein TWF694_008043 [Orbilia ellipsospora]|uniref:Uncharacterized protein n=1 Tax=Orbilia ellipsospora TaxID=2528407 RepID=A0AAV9XLK4_9PEZI
MFVTKYLSIFSCLIAVAAAAECYGPDRIRSFNGAGSSALSSLSWDGNNRRCTFASGPNGSVCKACYRTSGQPKRFGEAKGNIQDQCLSGTPSYTQGYWEADGLRVCFDCVNSPNCNGQTM